MAAPHAWPSPRSLQPVTLDEFLREEERMARDRESDSSSRPIPALLLPDESLARYEQNFRLWLGRRHVTLHGDIDVERRFRLDFADSRAWELRRRSIAGSEKTVEKSKNREQTALGEEKAVSNGRVVRLSEDDQGRLQYRGLRSRGELLATTLMTAEQFLARMEYFGPNGDMFAGSRLSPVAVVLRPSETIPEFETNFKRWLGTKDVTLARLQDDPEEERRYRQCFAYTRAREHLWREKLQTLRSTSGRCSRSPTRKVTLASAVGYDREAFRSPKRRRLGSEGTTVDLAPPGSTSRSNEGQTRIEPNSLDTGSCDLPRCIRSWADEMNQRVKQLENQLNRRSQESVVLQGPAVDDAADYASSTSSEPPERPRHMDYPTIGDPASGHKESRRCTRMPACRESSVMMDSTRQAMGLAGARAHRPEEETEAKPPGILVVDNQGADVVMIKIENRNQQSCRPGIFRAAAKTLAESERISVDPIKKRLVQDYTRLNDHISTSETAIEDSLAYVNLIVNIDKVGTAEHLSQIKALTVSTNKEKRHRDNALATLVAQDWAGKSEELDQLLQRTRLRGASHEKLVSIYVKLEQKREEVLASQATLKNRLSWFRAEDTIRDTQIQELDELQSKLTTELAAFSRLESRRQAMCVELLKANEGVHRLTIMLMEESKHAASSLKTAHYHDRGKT